MNQISAQTDSDGRLTATYGIAIVCLVISLTTCYYKGLWGPFLLDDFGSVKGAVVDSLDIDNLLKVATSDQSGIFGRSLSILTFAVNSYFSGSSTLSYKVANLTIHAVTAILIGTFLIRIFSQLNNHRQIFTRTELRYLAFFSTAIWALHPLQVSTVLYVVQRMTMLSTMFTVVALLIFVHLRTVNHCSRRRNILIFFITAASLAACLSKENGVLVIPYMLLIEFTVLRTGVSIDRNMKPSSNIKIASAGIVGILMLLLGIFNYHTELFSGYIMRDYDMWDRLMTQPGVLCLYLKMILLPNLADMSLYHDTYPVHRAFSLQIIFQVLIWVMFLVIGHVLRRRFPILIFGLGLFLIAHSLESTIFPLELVFEHRNYFGLLGIIIIFCWGIFAGLKTFFSTRSAVVTGVAVLTLLGFQTSLRSSEWSSAESFDTQALIRNPDSIRALNGWTTYLASQGKIKLAIEHLQHSHQIRPDSPHFLLQLLMFVGAGSEPAPALLAYVENELRTKPLKSEELASLGELLKYSTEGRFDWPSRNDLTKLYRIATEHEIKYLKKVSESLLFEQYSDLLKEAGKYKIALAAIQTSVQLDPRSPEPLIRQADLQFNLGELDSASQTLQALDRIDRYGSFAEQREHLANQILQRRIVISEMD